MTARSTSARRTLAVLLVAALALAATACGSDSSSASADEDTGPVTVTLKEHNIDPSRTTAKAGSITFDIANKGSETHEFLVVKSDLDPKALPLDEEGAVDEKGEGLEFIDEREDIGPGGTAKLTVDLQPGTYVLLCNLEDHYKMGMYQTFTVTS